MYTDQISHISFSRVLNIAGSFDWLFIGSASNVTALIRKRLHKLANYDGICRQLHIVSSKIIGVMRAEMLLQHSGDAPAYTESQKARGSHCHTAALRLLSDCTPETHSNERCNIDVQSHDANIHREATG